jgi:hypothetical protein
MYYAKAQYIVEEKHAIVILCKELSSPVKYILCSDGRKSSNVGGFCI